MSDASLRAYKPDNDLAKNESNGLDQTLNTREGSIAEIEETRNGQFHRSFSPRQVHVRIQ